MSGLELVVAVGAVFVGAVVQGSVGFGLGLVAAPVLALVEPGLVPGPLLVSITVLTALVAVRERIALDLRGLAWALAGRVPGTVAGAVVVASLSPRALSSALAVVVLLGVALSVVGWDPEPRPALLFSAGAASGFMGTTTSVGGPPVALAYQRSSGPELRATLGAFFLVGCLMSIAALSLTGSLGAADLRAATVLLPAVVVGHLVSGPLRPWVDRSGTRTAVLVVSAAAAGGLLVQQLVGS